MFPPVEPGFGLQGYQNLVLPSETVDEALRRYILNVCSKSLRDTAGYREWLLEATKRYEAMRSVRSLDDDDPGVPWKFASNVGIPAEAIAGESLLPRFNAATTDSEPIFRVELLHDDPDIKALEEDATRFYQDINTRRINLRNVRKETYMNLIIDGDGIEGPEWEESWVQQSETVAIFTDSNGQPKRDESGNLLLYISNIPETAYPVDSEGNKLKKVLVQRKGNRKIYEGPKVRSWRVSECIWPEDSTSPDVDSNDWFAVQMWKSRSWFKTREGDPVQGKLKNIQELIERHKNGIPPAFDGPDERGLTFDLQFPKMNKMLVWLWYGKFDVDNDGIDEEVIAWVAPAQRLLLGWQLTHFTRRPFFHYQLFRMPGRFTGRGIPHMVKGLRDTIDFLANSINNRINIYGDPPILWEGDSGYDPDIHDFGTGAQWGPLATGGLNKVKVLDLPEIQETVAKAFIEFYLSLIQRITSITDFSLGGPADTTAPNVKTAAGTQAVLAEGSMKFSDFVREYQQTSEFEMEFIDQELMSMVSTEETLKQMSPFKMKLDVLGFPKRFHATGSSLTMNRETVQQTAVVLFDKLVQDPIINLKPELQIYLRKLLFSAFDQSVVLPKPNEIEEQRIMDLKKMFLSMKPEERLAVMQEMQAAQAGVETRVNGNGAGSRAAA